MKNISLFDEHQCYNDRASKLDRQVSKLLRPLIKRELKAGVSHQDLHYVLLNTVQTDIIFSHAFQSLDDAKKKGSKKK